MGLERKLKIALDESRLLILGAQVLFGFQFQAVFQELFAELPMRLQHIHAAGLLLLLLAVALLIVPSVHHQIAFGGATRVGALEAATRFAGASLLPLTIGLGVSTFVVFSHLFATPAGLGVAGAFIVIGLGLLYGVGFVLRSGNRGAMKEEPAPTPLNVKIEQLLTEARVIIPGGQALLGFQLVATLTKAFAALPLATQLVHAVGLCAVAIAVMLLMTPAALHRIAYGGDNDPMFFRIGSWLVTAAVLPLALGISADVYVVFYKISDEVVLAALVAAASFALLIGLWLVYPASRRAKAAKDA